MIEKYIIDKEDLPKLIRGEELPLSQGSKARAFKIEIIGNLTNGDIIKAMFDVKVEDDFCKSIGIKLNDSNYVQFNKDWWNALYNAESEVEEE